MPTPPRPDLSVIDRAIERLRVRSAASSLHYACVELREAAGDPSIDESEYCNQFYMWAIHHYKGWPSWWNTGRKHPGRIRALRLFKQACIRAGKREARA